MSRNEPAVEADAVAEAAARFSGRLAAYVRARLRDPDEAQDVMQEIFLRAVRHREGLAGAANPAAWLHAVARSAIVDHVRRRRPMAPVEDVPDPAEEGEQQTELGDLSDCVAPLVENLPDHYRQALARVDLKGETHAALARELGLSVSAVKSRTQRGRKMLKEALVACCRLELDRQGRLVGAAPPLNEHCCPPQSLPSGSR